MSWRRGLNLLEFTMEASANKNHPSYKPSWYLADPQLQQHPGWQTGSPHGPANSTATAPQVADFVPLGEMPEVGKSHMQPRSSV